MVLSKFIHFLKVMSNETYPTWSVVIWEVFINPFLPFTRSFMTWVTIISFIKNFSLINMWQNSAPAISTSCDNVYHTITVFFTRKGWLTLIPPSLSLKGSPVLLSKLHKIHKCPASCGPSRNSTGPCPSLCTPSALSTITPLPSPNWELHNILLKFWPHCRPEDCPPAGAPRPGAQQTPQSWSTNSSPWNWTTWMTSYKPCFPEDAQIHAGCGQPERLQEPVRPHAEGQWRMGEKEGSCRCDVRGC